jgi:hypothetical protein
MCQCFSVERYWAAFGCLQETWYKDVHQVPSQPGNGRVKAGVGFVRFESVENSMRVLPQGQDAESIRRYMSRHEVATYVGISTRAWDSISGAVPSIRLGRRKLYDREDVDRFLAAHKAA